MLTTIELLADSCLLREQEQVKPKCLISLRSTPHNATAIMELPGAEDSHLPRPSTSHTPSSPYNHHHHPDLPTSASAPGASRRHWPKFLDST